MVEKANGQVLTIHDAIEEDVLDFYGKLMGTKHHTLDCVDICALRNDNQLHRDQRLNLERGITEE